MLFRNMVLIYTTTQQHIPEHCVTAIKSESCVTFFVVIFAKLQRVAINLVVSVHPSVCTKQLGSNWTDFHEILYTRMFRQSLEQIKVSS